MLRLVNGLLDREYFQFVSARTIESSAVDMTIDAPCAGDMVPSPRLFHPCSGCLQGCQSPAKQIGWCVVCIVGVLSVGWILLCVLVVVPWLSWPRRDHGWSGWRRHRL